MYSSTCFWMCSGRPVRQSIGVPQANGFFFPGGVITLGGGREDGGIAMIHNFNLGLQNFNLGLQAQLGQNARMGSDTSRPEATSDSDEKKSPIVSPRHAPGTYDAASEASRRRSADEIWHSLTRSVSANS